MSVIKPSELILNPDGSVYHLHLLPEDISETIITVGDPNRVKMVSAYFDTIEVKKEKREFFTHTGTYKGKRLTVISTGIGTDNIDIVFNELDALVNIDLKTRTIKKTHTALNFIRIGTSGCMHKDIPIDATLLSSHGLGMDGLLNYYEYSQSTEEKAMHNELEQLSLFESLGIRPYVFEGSSLLRSIFEDETTFAGITTTCTGFYGPQGRELRLRPKVSDLVDQLSRVVLCGHQVTNFEMETAGIYGLASLLGHEALSINLLIANRARGEFSKDPKASMTNLIQWVLDKLVS